MNSEEPLTNKLSIYLLKESVTATDDIFDDVSNAIDLVSVGRLYVPPSNTKTPDWVNKFFGSNINNLANLRIFTAAARAVLLVENISGRKFAICFGYGKHLIKPGAIEPRFGLKTTLNIIDQNSIRSIDKTSLESVPKHSKEQISQDGSKESFGLNIEQDMVRAITGKSKSGFEHFGKIVSGKDALYVNVKVDTTNIREFLSSCYERYQSNDYKTNFEWVDQISEVDDRQLRAELGERLIQKLEGGERDKIWVATPEQIEWSEVAGFAYGRFREGEPLGEDVSLSKILELLGDNLSIEKLKREKVLAISSETNHILHTWSAFECLYAEIENSDKTYLVTNGKWYQINKDFVDRVNRECNQIPSYAQVLPNYSKTTHGNENGYNVALADSLGGICLDANNIRYGGGQSSIEFCDVYGADKTIFHIKHYSGSSPLSHLFSQGAVSGELLRSDPEFRAEVNNKLHAGFKIPDPDAEYLPDGQKIVFGIITRQPHGLTLPFFSKVNIRNAQRLLTGLGFRVQLAAISNRSDGVEG